MRLFFKSLSVEIVSVSCIASQTTDPTPQYAASPVAVHTLPVPHGRWAQESLSSSAGVSPAASLLLLRHWSPPRSRALLQSVHFVGETNKAERKNDLPT